MPSRERSQRSDRGPAPPPGRRPAASLFISAIAAALAFDVAIASCSSDSSPNPPIPSGCMDVNGVPCTAGATGGGPSAQGDGGFVEDGTIGATGDATSCPGADLIFSNATTSCVACIAASCCLNPTSCPNDTACTPIAACVATCVPTEPNCLQTCEGTASAPVISEFLDLASCSMTNCPMCPTLQTANSDL
jgi:hypothetical protein